MIQIESASFYVVRLLHERQKRMFDPTAMFLSLIAGGAGFVMLVYGKKQGRVPYLIAGLAFMVYPYFVDSAGVTILVGLALAVGLWLAVRAGW